MSKSILINAYRKNFETYKLVTEHAFRQLDQNGLHWQPAMNSNSVAVLIKHISGHLTSRYSDFFNSDGESENRNKEKEFLNEQLSSAELEKIWNDAWDIVFETLDNLTDNDLPRNKLLRREPIPVAEYIPRTLVHFAYHAGQIVLLSKQYSGSNWKALL